MGDFSKLPDHELVALLKEGSDPAFNTIHLRYYGLLYRHAFHRFTSLRDKEEVEDLLQDLMIWIRISDTGTCDQCHRHTAK